ncbi:MAG: hypothetical protein LBI06_01745 [Treponema sp.]|nr:hypothetical protein [Treponema sp.]
MPPINSYSGTYQIAFNASSTAPLPSNAATATTLAFAVWDDGNIAAAGGEHWFKFTATASTQYIHVVPDTLEYLYVQIYDSSGGTVGDYAYLNNSTRSASRSLTSGQTYYIGVRPSISSNGSGTYQIAFNASSTAP